MEWIPVSERLPEKIGCVLIYRSPIDDTDEIAWAFFNSEENWAGFNSDGNQLYTYVTHWQPLPPAPETD